MSSAARCVLAQYSSTLRRAKGIYSVRTTRTAYAYREEHTMRNRTVLISGAGIGGPALPFWLSRRGFTPTVVEVAPAPRPGGHAVDLRGAGREAVERTGLMPALRHARADPRGVASR